MVDTEELLLRVLSHALQRVADRDRRLRAILMIAEDHTDGATDRSPEASDWNAIAGIADRSTPLETLPQMNPLLPWILVLLLASTAQASPLVPGDASWIFTFSVSATDGLTYRSEAFRELQQWTPVEGIVTTTAEVIGTTGTFIVYDVLAGDLAVSLPEMSFSGVGITSGQPWSLTFTTLEARVEGDPLTLAPQHQHPNASGDALVTSLMHVVGLWTAGSHSLPFDSTFSEPTTVAGYRGGSDQLLIDFHLQNALPHLFYEEGGIAYEAGLRVGVGANAIVPEPGTGLLLAVALLLGAFLRKWSR